MILSLSTIAAIVTEDIEVHNLMTFYKVNSMKSDIGLHYISNRSTFLFL